MRSSRTGPSIKKEIMITKLLLVGLLFQAPTKENAQPTKLELAEIGKILEMNTTYAREFNKLRDMQLNMQVYFEELKKQHNAYGYTLDSNYNWTPEPKSETKKQPKGKK